VQPQKHLGLLPVKLKKSEQKVSFKQLADLTVSPRSVIDKCAPMLQPVIDKKTLHNFFKDYLQLNEQQAPVVQSPHERHHP
jgi:hypothetical protein